MRLSDTTTEQLVKLASDYRFVGTECLASIVEELIDRRAAEDSELRKIERSLAYSLAVMCIEGSSAPVPHLGEGWFDVDDQDEYAGDDVDETVRYLELRGLLERDATNRNHIAIRDESEATA